MSDTHAQMREMARDLIRNSVIEDAIAQKIALIIEHIYDTHIKPLQERAYTRADMEAAIKRVLEGAAEEASVCWMDGVPYPECEDYIRRLDPAQFIEEEV